MAVAIFVTAEHSFVYGADTHQLPRCQGRPNRKVLVLTYLSNRLVNIGFPKQLDKSLTFSVPPRFLQYKPVNCAAIVKAVKVLVNVFWGVLAVRCV